MSLTPPAGLEEDDFEAIEDAVMETARGRWFLREFGRRARAVDTSRLMESLTRIESVLAGRQPVIDAVAVDYEEHARSLEERHGRLGEIAWMLRERGYDGDICAMIEKEARAVGRLARTLRGGGPLRDEPRAIAETAPARLEPPRAIEGPAAAEDSSRFSIPGDEVAGAATSLPSGEGGERQRAGWGRFEAAEIQADPLRRADGAPPPPEGEEEVRPSSSPPSMDDARPPDLPAPSPSATVEPAPPPPDWRMAAVAALASFDRMSTREKLALFA